MLSSPAETRLGLASAMTTAWQGRTHMLVPPSGRVLLDLLNLKIPQLS